ncbi:ribonucleoside-triphosphate reductase, adenosylcobalamin-dependent, partial [Chroococcidiopsidales cyanobacterium LEGE 13417]|nr:ribonucleoside-triphosphate reductase, adenosylcobalamin-dependent [Chroococcidiopsidales cyanobacterium LEGE 13417]
MVRELQRLTQTTQFPETAPAANPVFFRTYSRRIGGGRETWEQVCDRTLRGLVELGKLTPAEAAILEKMQKEMKSLPSGRWLWVGGTEWISRPENFSGAYNCTSTNVVDWRAFGLMMDLAMMGCGTGAILEPQYINQLPVIRNRLHVTVEGEIGTNPASERREETEVQIEGNIVNILVGDSRRGWVKSYQTLLELSTNDAFSGVVHVSVNLSNIRPAGEILKGFGGVANPIKLPELYQRCAAILNKAVGRKLNSVECCLLIDEAAVVVVAGNVRRCLPEDALVHTSKGLIPIRDIQIGDLVQTPLGFRHVIDKFDQGVQEVYEIETNGTFPRATLNHRIAVLADAKGKINWQQIGDLVEGDRLMHNTQVLPGTVTQLPRDFTTERPIQSRNASPISIPELTPDVAWLIGLTHGDGYVSLGRNKHGKPYGAISWACSSLDEELATKIHNKIDRALALFGLKATHVLLSSENTLRSRVTSIRLAEYFHKYIKQPNQPIEIPDFILQGSVDIRAAYLAGLVDSDGAINNRPPHLVTTVYRSFARQVAAVLSSLGIAGRVKLTRPQIEKWQVKYHVTIPALKNQYNALIALHSVKGELRQGLKMYGFTIPGSLMREVYSYSEMRGMGFQGSRDVDANYERYVAESDICLDIPVTVNGLGSYDCVQTYDIEVAEAHCFYCDGYLTHNSAGMRQGNSNDELFEAAKTNLWQQDESGNWRIDPDRDALRMANHSRVFHQKPTLEECINAVRNQYYSGEGAIQWAGEAIARANHDLLNTSVLKAEFLKAYSLSLGNAKQWLQEHYPQMSVNELEHRLSRYGLNPCHSGDTLVSTEQGLVPIKDLVDRQFKALVDLRSVGLDGVKLTNAIAFTTGVQPTYLITLHNGMKMKCTSEHKHFTNKGWVATKELTLEHSIFIQKGEGQFGSSTISIEQAQMLGWWFGDGFQTIEKAEIGVRKTDRTVRGFYFNSKEFEYAYPIITSALESIGGTRDAYHINKGIYRVHCCSFLIDSFFNKLNISSKASLPVSFFSQSREVVIGFLQGLFSADGSVQKYRQAVELFSASQKLLEQVQILLLNLGIPSCIYRKNSAGSIKVPYTLKDGTIKNSYGKEYYRLVIRSIHAQKYSELVGFPLAPEKQAILQEHIVKNMRKRRASSINLMFASTVKSVELQGEETVYDLHVPLTHSFIANGCVTHNCGEILGADFHCNLSEVHLNQIDPKNDQEQEEAFTAGALTV